MDGNLLALILGLGIGILVLIVILRVLPGPGDENAQLYADRISLGYRNASSPTPSLPRRALAFLRRLFRLVGPG